MLLTVAGMLAPHFDVVAAVSDGKAVLDAVARTNPDLVLLDIMMPGLDGFQAARELKKRKSGAKVVFVTGQDDDDYIAEALDVGAKGYVVKSRLQSDLIPAINVALAGQLFISPHAFTEFKLAAVGSKPDY
jgi:DNA-binding NarL/FixJ family response regulator